MKIKRSLIIGVFALVLVSMGSMAMASPRQDDGHKTMTFGLSGGLGYSYVQGGLYDVKAEIQFFFRRNFSLGLGVGYMSDLDLEWRRWGERDQRHGRVEPVRANDPGTAIERGFRSVPLTLTVSHFRRFSRWIETYAFVGGGYYFNDFRDASLGRKNAWGAHGGLGVNVNLSSRFQVMVEGLYRYVGLGGRHGDSRDERDEDARMGSISTAQNDGRQGCSPDGHGYEQGMSDGRRDLRNSLNGFNLRVGLKVGF